ncbi:MAG: F0F1 ATP synthase subunit delta [Spirochaetaceae bacterium]|jgi:hypothetical protein|nr:F0F1 ATP synthase subunit delta [Spirochaetaceae bacterium]
MFNADRWAEAYLAVCGKDGEDPAFGLEFLGTVLPLAGRVSAFAPGTRSADRFAATVEKAAGETGIAGVRAAVALTRLFMRREGECCANGKYARLTDAIGRLIDKRQGVLRGTLEAAGKEETHGRFLRDLETALGKKYGAKAVSLETKVNPALLGGYRWTIESEGARTDCSLAGRLSQMERALKNAGR